MRLTRMWAALVILWSCFGLAIASTRFGVFRFRSVLILFALLTGTIVVRAWLRGWRPRVPPPEIVLLLGLQVLLVLIGSLSVDPGTRPFLISSTLVLTGCGWLTWIETRERPTSGDVTVVSDRAADYIAGGCMLVAGILALFFWRANAAPLVASYEELMYRTQAAALAGHAADYRVSADVLQAFRLPGVAYAGDTLIPSSAAGWPLLLGLAQRLGVGPWLALGFTLLNVLFAASLARRLFGARGGFLAAAFVAFNPLIVRFGPSWLAHAATTTLLLGALLILLPALERPQAARGIGAGVLFGMALITLPVTATVVIMAVLVWLHVRTSAQRSSPLPRALPSLALGMLPVLLACILTDNFSLGSPLRWGHGDLFAGAVPTGDTQVLAFEVSEVVKASWFSFGAAGLLPFAGLLLLSGVRLRPAIIAGFLLLPVVLVGIVGGGVGAYHDLVPFLALAFAWGVLELRRRDATLARATITLTLAGALATSVLLLYSLGRIDTRPADLHAGVEAAQARWGNLLIFLPIGTPDEIAGRLWTYNLDGVGGTVVVARETTPYTNRRVLAELPGRQVLLLRRERDGRWAFEPLIWHLSPDDTHAFLPRLDRPGG